MKNHNPSDIFTVAEQFRNSSKALNLTSSGDMAIDNVPFPYDVKVPMVTCSAFALELYLKCLIAMETGKAPPNGHDLQDLFHKLHKSTKKEIRDFFDKIGAPTIDFIKGEFAREGKPAPKIDFDYVLNASRDAFKLVRYIYERGLHAEQGWVAEYIMEGARATILRRYPHWEGARQIVPTIVLGQPPAAA